MLLWLKYLGSFIDLVKLMSPIDSVVCVLSGLWATVFRAKRCAAPSWLPATLTVIMIEWFSTCLGLSWSLIKIFTFCCDYSILLLLLFDYSKFLLILWKNPVYSLILKKMIFRGFKNKTVCKVILIGSTNWVKNRKSKINSNLVIWYFWAKISNFHYYLPIFIIN